MDLSQLLAAARGTGESQKAAEEALAKLREQNLVRTPSDFAALAGVTDACARDCCFFPCVLSSLLRAAILLLVVLRACF